MASIKEMKELLQQFRAQGNEKEVANLAFKLGDTYRERGKWEEAYPLLEESHELCRKHQNAEGAAVVALSLAEFHLGRAEPGQAETVARPALAFYREHQDMKGLVRASLLLGDTHWARKEYELAVPYYEEALTPCKEHGDVPGTASLLDRLAKMHRLLKKEEQALAYFQESLDGWQKLSIPDREAMTWANMGDIYKRRGDLSRAMRCHEQALSLYRSLRNLKAVGVLEKELEAIRETQEGDPAGGEEKKSKAD